MPKNTYESSEAFCDNYTPMGKAGALVIQVPVVLSSLKISIPLYRKININQNCRNLKTCYNKVFLSKLQLNSKNQLFLNGYIRKSLNYYADFNNNPRINIKIPFNKKVTIKFDQIPTHTYEYNNSYFQKSAEPINYSIQSIKILNDSILKIKMNYISTMVLSIKLYLTQVQNVFIQEPEGDVMLLSANSTPHILNNFKNKDFYYTVGYNSHIGLFANKNIIF